MRLAIVAADYTPGEADQLRRDMAAWRRSGRIEKHRERLISRMETKGITRDFAERVFAQIRGFGEYGFPECVSGDTRVIDADSGRWVTIEDVASGRAPLRHTLTCSDDLTIEKRPVVAVKRAGRKQVYRLRTALGREIRATREHPFLTMTGWRQLGALRVGDAVATARELPAISELDRSKVYWDRIEVIEAEGEEETFDLSIEGNHNFLANDFVVHNSHAASFAMIAFATTWVRKHYMAEFTCGLLNAQPMGFYAPATIVGDARRHGVEVRPIDVNVSEWDCTIEAEGGARAVRMGLRWVRGLGVEQGRRVTAARAAGGFGSVEAFTRRVRLEGREYAALAEAGALGALEPERRDALWQVAGWGRRQGDQLRLGDGDAEHRGWDGDDVRFSPLDLFDQITWDYRISDHSTRGHPLGPMRTHLTARRFPDARTVGKLGDGERVEYVGIVICRQRPGTASGVTFMTMEDETGFVNVIVWPAVFEQHAITVRTAALLGVRGQLQNQEGIVHLIADDFFRLEFPRPVPDIASRDF